MATYHSSRAAFAGLGNSTATSGAVAGRPASISGISNSVLENSGPLYHVVTVSVPGMQGARGPQGPEPDLTFLDTAAVRSLTSADRGSVLEWNGSQYAPSSLLENDLTISGGNF